MLIQCIEYFKTHEILRKTTVAIQSTRYRYRNKAMLGKQTNKSKRVSSCRCRSNCTKWIVCETKKYAYNVVVVHWSRLCECLCCLLLCCVRLFLVNFRCRVLKWNNFLLLKELLLTRQGSEMHLCFLAYEYAIQLRDILYLPKKYIQMPCTNA